MDHNKLQSILYRHLIAARDLDTETANKLVRLLNAGDAELVDKIAGQYAQIDKTGRDKAPVKTKRFEDMLAQIREVNAKAYKPYAAGVRAEVLDRATHEAEIAAKAFKEAGGAIDIGAVIPSTDFLKSLVENTPIPVNNNGVALLKPWLDSMEKGRFDRLEQAIRLGALQGETADDLVKRIAGTKAANYTDGILQISRQSAQTLAITANSAVQNNARLETFKGMKSIKFVEWSSILDTRTSEICQSRSGDVYPIDKPHPKPPAHPRCRSVLLPRRDADGAKHKPIPDWLRGESEEVQDEVMGKARADIFRANPDFNFKGYFRDDGSYKSLTELKKFDERLFTGGVKSPPKQAPKAPATVEIIDTKAIDQRERAYVLDKGKATGVEHLVAYDDMTGEVIERKKGKKSSVSFSQELITALANPNNRIVLHHNHPGSSSLSYQDLKVVTGQPGAKAIWAHGHNGSSFYAEPGEFALKRTTVDAISGALLNALQKLINLGAVKIEEAQLLHNHLTWLAVHHVGQIKYIAELSGESKAAFERNRVIYEQLLESLKQ